jgi:hypothetical protein
LKNKGVVTPVVFVLGSVIFFTFDWVRFDLSKKINNSLIIGNFVWFIYFLYGCMGVWSVIYLIKKLSVYRWKAFIPIAIVIITILYFLLIPLSNIYLNIDYKLNGGNRAKIVQMVQNDQMQRNQIGENKYIVPYRLTSHTGYIYVQKNTLVTKIMFYVYCGIGKSRVIIYSSNDSEINENDFNSGIPVTNSHFRDIKKMEKYWYSATFK